MVAEVEAVADLAKAVVRIGEVEVDKETRTLADHTLAVEHHDLALGKDGVLAGIVLDAHQFVRAERRVAGPLQLLPVRRSTPGEWS